MSDSLILHLESVYQRIYNVRKVSQNAIPSRKILGTSIPIRASINNNIDIYTNGAKFIVDFIDSIADFNITSTAYASLTNPIFYRKDT
jgi:hypothetical protein